MIQVAISNATYAVALRDLLIRNGAEEVVCVDAPDLGRDGVTVLDPEHLQRIPLPLPDPGRVVLIARNHPSCLEHAWEAGVNSVVFDNDPLNTAVLAIMGATLESARPKRAAAGWEAMSRAEGAGNQGRCLAGARDAQAREKRVCPDKERPG